MTCRRDLLDISPTLTEAAGAIVDVSFILFFCFCNLHFAAGGSFIGSFLALRFLLLLTLWFHWIMFKSYFGLFYRVKFELGFG